jgi:transcriptional regulator with XRE-family HTH domain
MADWLPPEVSMVLIRVLCDLRRWKPRELAAAAGVDASSIYRYEKGTFVPSRPTVERFVVAVGLPVALLDVLLLPVIRALLDGAPVPGSLEDLEQSAEKLGSRLAAGFRMGAIALLRELAREEARGARRPASAPSEEDALDLWERLASCTFDEALFLVETAAEFQTPALARRLVEESEKATAEDPARRLDLTRLSRRVAELAPGEPA